MLPKTQNPLVRLASTTINTTARVNMRLASKWAYHLFTVPRYSQVSEAGAAFLATAEQATLSYQSVPIQVYHWPGTGPNVLLAHGWESNSSRWRTLIEDLRAAGFAVTALDAPAHGNSGGTHFHAVAYAEFIAEVRAAYPFAYAVGHSAGGMALVYLLTHLCPDEPLEKLILMGVPNQLTDLLDLYADVLQLDQRVMDGVNSLIQHRFERPPSYFSIAEFAARLDLPGLIIHDRDDPIAQFSCAEAIAAAWSQAELVPVEGKGHSLYGADIRRRVVDFLQ